MISLEKRFSEWTRRINENWFGSTKENEDGKEQFIWYRGVSKCSYDLTTSFQRNSVVNEMELRQYYEKIRKCINGLDTDDFILTDYENFGFAFLQHRGFPSPLLDWTSYPMVAAQFACHDWIVKEQKTDAAIYALNVKKFMELFDIQYKVSMSFCEDNVYGKKDQKIVENIPPLRVGPGITSLSEMEKPMPFRGFRSPYLSADWEDKMETIIKDPLIARMAPQSGKFIYVPGKESLDAQIKKRCDIEGIDKEDVIQKFSICVSEKDQIKSVLENNVSTGGAFGNYIAYDKLFPEKKASEIDSKLEGLRNLLNNRCF
ncbi:hypothetical protein AC806_01925 [Tetragenococcus halophilus]|uniref:FRG domain-containing protein n=1 Tax=Tetragenococcus halophilus TaxID=51669 RepID=UPI00083D8915|nr:FRG domain-containing protein [Tetragenococcus halophilus]AOF48264.1 hypothetical protein AC806_01925 [Tetragenococcus halophilus]